jgi:hypothetical protein
MHEELSDFPGGDLVFKGLADLDNGIASEEAVLLMVASPRLEWLGFRVRLLDQVGKPYEHALYSMIEDRLPIGAHSAYNALIGRIVSFANAYPARK